MGPVDAVILSGGKGTRLSPVLGGRPKVLAPVAGRPFLCWMLSWLHHLGVSHVVLCTGHGADEVDSFLEDPTVRALGLEIDCVRDPMPLGTGGALRNALTATRSARLLALNGDSYCRFDQGALIERHRATGARATLLLTTERDTSRFGSVELDDAGWIRAFNEKGASREAGLINAGVYLLERDAVESIPTRREISLEREVFPEWIGHGLLGFVSEGPFIDIGTPQSYAEASTRIDWNAIAGPVS